MFALRVSASGTPTLPPGTVSSRTGQPDAGRRVDLFQVGHAGGGFGRKAFPFLADPDAAATPAADRPAVAPAGHHRAIVEHHAVGIVEGAVGGAQARQRAAADAAAGRDLGPEQVAALAVGEHGPGFAFGPEAPSVVAEHAKPPRADPPQNPSYASAGETVKVGQGRTG